MSRRAFRERVDNVRPSAALFMVATATATLAVTGHIQPWALVLCTLAIGYAAWRWGEPADWQRDGLWLNLGLAAALGVAALLWLRGELAILALAHFVLLVQGLQLLDARPRRSEFLLVALALFQVVTAANLTDSGVYPLLLVLFAGSATWTLVVHTLRAEALEAGDPTAASAAIGGDLRRSTLHACGLSLLLAMLLFPLLPRLRSGALLSAGMSPPMSVAGFSDQVELGDLGRIRLDPTVVLRVETLTGETPSAEARYWRGLAFDHFDGTRWTVTPVRGQSSVAGDTEVGFVLVQRPKGERRLQRIAREGIEPGVIFADGRPIGIRGGLGLLKRDDNGSLYAHQTAGERVDYEITTEIATRDDDALSFDRTSLPDAHGERYLQLPRLDPAVRTLAERITWGAQNDSSRAAAIESHLRRTGRYTDTPPHGTAQAPLERFLLDSMEGHCEYFASAMVMLSRSVGLPARIVNGFAGGSTNTLGDFVELAQSDAHTWVEIHFKTAGWVRYDPTPTDLRLAGAEALRGHRNLGELLGTLELWWFRNVVEFDRGHQARALQRALDAWRRWRSHSRAGTPGGPPGAEGPQESPALPDLRLWLLPLALLATGLALYRRRTSARDPLPAFYARALRLLARRGLHRGATTTARSFAHQSHAALPAPAAAAFDRLTEAYLAQRFGGRLAADPETALQELRAGLRGGAPQS